MNKLIEIWCNAIINGTHTYSEVPAKLAEKVAERLRAEGYEDLIIP